MWASVTFTVQVTVSECVQKNFGGGAERLNMHERMADVILDAFSNGREGKGEAGHCTLIAPRDM